MWVVHRRWRRWAQNHGVPWATRHDMPRRGRRWQWQSTIPNKSQVQRRRGGHPWTAGAREGVMVPKHFTTIPARHLWSMVTREERVLGLARSSTMARRRRSSASAIPMSLRTSDGSHRWTSSISCM